jgi:hypothetical protein
VLGGCLRATGKHQGWAGRQGPATGQESIICGLFCNNSRASCPPSPLW